MCRLLVLVMLIGPLAGCFSRKSLEQDGGVILVYELADKDASVSDEVLEAVRQRLAPWRRQVEVKTLEPGSIQITLIGLSEEAVEGAKGNLATDGQLEFRIVACRGVDDGLIAAAEKDDAPPDQEQPFARWVAYDPQHVQFSPEAVTREVDGRHQVLIIDDELDISAELLSSVYESFGEQGWQVNGEFNPDGARRMQALSSRNLPNHGLERQLGILFDGEMIRAPHITAEFSDRFAITGQFTESEVSSMAAALQFGRFPTRLNPQPVSEQRVLPKGD